MRGGHYEDYELLAYLDRAENMLDLDDAKQHFAKCEECAVRLERLERFIGFLSDKNVHQHTARKRRVARRRHMRDVLARMLRDSDEELEASHTFDELMNRPIEAWPRFLAERPKLCTESLVVRLTAEGRHELEQRPEHALAMFIVAEGVASMLTDAFGIAEYRGNLAKERANALRILGRYPEALEALDSAEAFLSHLPAPDYDLTFIRWGRATVLFYMTRYGEARALAEGVVRIFDKFGETEYGHLARILLANIRCEQGEVEQAAATYRELLAYFEEQRDREMVPKLNANLADCAVRLDRPEEALMYASLAAEGYERFGNVTENTRLRWTLGHRLLRQAHFDQAFELLSATYAEFKALGMVTAAGGVGLDLAEIHLRLGEWDDAEELARELVKVFTAAQAPLHQTQAMHTLHDAAEQRTLTADLIAVLRVYFPEEDAFAHSAPN